jgi:hypothetical protein
MLPKTPVLATLKRRGLPAFSGRECIRKWRFRIHRIAFNPAKKRVASSTARLFERAGREGARPSDRKAIDEGSIAIPESQRLVEDECNASKPNIIREAVLASPDSTAVTAQKVGRTERRVRQIKKEENSAYAGKTSAPPRHRQVLQINSGTKPSTAAEKTQQTANLPLKALREEPGRPTKVERGNPDILENVRINDFGNAATYRTAKLPLKALREEPGRPTNVERDNGSNPENITIIERGTAATYRTAKLPLKLNAVGDNQHNGGCDNSENITGD